MWLLGTIRNIYLRLLLLISVCLMIVGLTSVYMRDSKHVISRFSTAVGDFSKWKLSSAKRKVWDIIPPLPEEQTTKNKTEEKVCPVLSPQLMWARQLTFDPNLSLEGVARRNPKVDHGRYHPYGCRAQQRVAILIPHRRREKHLLYLLDNLHPFLQRQQLDYGIYVIHQAGDGKFNRAKLLNVGYLEALKDENWDCFIFHDVDLIPENDFNTYLCDTEPKHLLYGSNVTEYKLMYKQNFGGVTAMTRNQFALVNGHSNSYWGWGGEDDDLWIRVAHNRMEVVRPPEEIGRYTMVFHTRDKGNEVNNKRMLLLYRVTRMWKTDGLNSCTYNLLSVDRQPLYINITVDIGKPRY